MAGKKKFSFIRFILKSLCGLVVFLVVALIGVYFYLGLIVREGVNRYVPPITGTTASVASVDLSLFKGQIEIKNLQIGNPKGFSSNDILNLGRVQVSFEPKTVFADKIIIKSVVISEIKVSAEMKNLHSLDSNISVLQDNINKYIGTSSEENAGKKETSNEESGKKVVVKDLKIKDISLSLGVSGQTVTLPLPDIHKTGIGEDKKGKSIGRVFADILNMISLESVKGLGTAVSELAKKGLKGTKDVVSGGADAVTGAAKSVTDGAKNTFDGIKGMFK